MIRWARAAFFAAAAYGAVAFWQSYETRTLVKTAQDTYTAIDRPYVGIDTVDRAFIKLDAHGNVINLGGNAKGAQAMGYRIGTKNYGSVPAEKFSSESKMTIGDEQVPGIYASKTPGELFPGQTVFFVVSVGQSSYEDVIYGRKRLSLFVHLTYQYAGKSYEYCEKQQYEVGPRSSLVSAGVDCSPGWDR